jgi:hypothetical protein
MEVPVRSIIAQYLKLYPLVSPTQTLCTVTSSAAVNDNFGTTAALPKKLHHDVHAATRLVLLPRTKRSAYHTHHGPRL